MTLALVTCLLAVPAAQAEGSGAAPVGAGSADIRAQGLVARVSAPEHYAAVSERASLLPTVRSTDSTGGNLKGSTRARSETCRSSKRAIRFYAARVTYWQRKLGSVPLVRRDVLNCGRYLAHVLQRKARALRREHARWRAYHYDWRSWLPDKWQRIGACETGYGRRPGSWTWNSGAYQGAFGFARSSWDAFVRHADRKAGPYPSEAYLATPRQQYEVALAIWRAFGFSGWGCRNA